MLITYIRSSGLGDFELCQHKFYINYTLGYRFPANKAANLGTTFHKCMELMALRKLTEQQGGLLFTETDTKQLLPTTITVQEIVEFSFNHYKNKFGFLNEDKKIIEKYVADVMCYRRGAFSPLKREIISSEKYFDLEMPQNWAKYSYKLGDEIIQGRLRIRGTIDLITRANSSTIESTDWKTGSDNCWISGEKKDFTKLRKDPQIRLYFYAMNKLYPEYKYKIMSQFYTKRTHQGPRTIYFGEEDIEESELMIKNYFEKIKNISIPKLIAPSFKCKFCSFSSEIWKNGKNYCSFFKEEIRKNGLDKTTEQYILREQINSYTGGGKTLK